MAVKAKRRRHNKANASYLFSAKGEKVPRSRKAFKLIMREQRAYEAHDISIIKNVLRGTLEGSLVYVSSKTYKLNNTLLAGYYTLVKGVPTKLSGETLKKAKELGL